MKRSGCKTVIGLLVVQAAFILFSTAYAAEVEKKYSKEYNATGKDLLSISNRYGEVVVQSWDGNTVSIEVIVTVEHPSQDKAEKYLEMIEVLFSDNDNTIEARTEIDKNFSFKGGGDRSFSIDYLVKMPAALNLGLENKYGNVKVGDLSGHVDIAVKYGSLFVGKLTRGKGEPLNSVSIAYGKGEIVEAGWLELTLRYVGSMNLTRANAVVLDSKYSKVSIEEASSIVSETKYDNIVIGTITNFVAEGGYTGFDLGVVKGKLDISTGYGSIKVEKVMKGFEAVDIEAKYCQVRLGMDSEASYKLDVETSYGGISFDEDRADISKRIYENNHKSIEAVVGDKGTTSAIRIDTSYGSVKVY